MRCLFVADLHYSLPQFDWLLHAAHRFDLVALAGDALDVGSIVDFRAQTLVARKYLQRLSQVTRLIVCSGNHDLDSRGDTGEKFARWLADLRDFGIATDGDSIGVDGTLFSICPWWDGPVARDALHTQLEQAAARREGQRWIWIHHAPPLNSPTSWSGSRSMGDVDLEQLVTRLGPDLVVCGHIHQSPFVSNGSWADRIGRTWVFNAGHQFGAPPAYIALDTTVGEAVWVSAMGVQVIDLGRPLMRPIPPATTLPDWLRKTD